MKISSRALWNAIRFAATSIFLFGIWLVFSADLGVVWLGFGFTCSLLIGFLTYKNFIGENEAGLYSVLPRPLMLLPALFYLIVSMYSASFRVFIAILRNSINPGMVFVRTRLSSDLGRTALANAITFTPGTVAVSLDEDHISIHWLFVSTRHSRAAGDIIKGNMEQYIKRVWI